MIALTRAVLAFVFLFALWIDPDQPARVATAGYVILGGYFLLSLVLLVLSWRSWWWDHRLAWPLMAVDICAFLSAVAVTEGIASDFTSPFLAFFAFLMLAATIRWDWRATVAAGLAVTGLYLLLGIYFASVEPAFDILRFGRRISYMLVLTLVLAWFGLQRREQAIEHFVELPEERGSLLTQALRFAVAQANPGRAAIAWVDHEEPDVQIAAYGFDIPSHLGPQQFDAETGFARAALLFNIERQRSLVARRGNRPEATTGPISNSLVELCGVNEGIVLPLAGLTGRGELLLTNIEGVSADHVGLGLLLAREITAAFDRQATLSLANESALARVRDSLAHDLHDSVAQSLAGMSLRLEALRAWIRGGGDPEAEIESIKQSLREEQRHVRSLIARLRRDTVGEEPIDVSTATRPLLSALTAQWGAGVKIRLGDQALALPGSLVHEIGQILREAVANAVRHGGASEIDLSIDVAGEELHMTIADNGSGFSKGMARSRPWSISERVGKLRGRLEVTSGPRGATLGIVVPLSVAA